MKSIIVNINIEYLVDVKTDEQAKEFMQQIELPSGYQEDTFEIVKITDIGGKMNKYDDKYQCCCCELYFDKPTDKGDCPHCGSGHFALGCIDEPEPKQKRFEFTVVMPGYGETPEIAWQDVLDTIANDSHFQTFDKNETPFVITDIDGKAVEKPKREYVLISTLDANNQFQLDATDTESALYEALNLLNYTLTSN